MIIIELNNLLELKNLPDIYVPFKYPKYKNEKT